MNYLDFLAAVIGWRWAEGVWDYFIDNKRVSDDAYAEPSIMEFYSRSKSS